MLRNLQVSGRSVSCDPDAMESLRQHVMERFLAAEPVGEETVGILYGRAEGELLVTAWRAIARENPSAPAVPLTSADEVALRELMKANVDGAGAAGWFRSRTRGMAALSPEDLAACQLLFESRECLSVILRPSTQRPVAASFGFVVPGAEAESSQRGVRVALSPPQSQKETAEAETAPAPVEDIPEPVEAAARGRWLKPLLAFAVGVALSSVAMWFFLDRPLRLQVRVSGPEAAVEWNRSAGFFTRADSAILRLGERTVPISQSQLRQGRWAGAAPPGDFAVSLHLQGGFGGPRWGGVTVVRPVE
jgi:proteasome lid subunit RPN8/RPN11